MDCYDHGIIKKNDYDLDLNWGNMDAAIKLLKDITERNGLGNVLADGVLRASKKLGKGAEKFAIQVKGLEGAAPDPSSGKALALTYGCSNVGMSHIYPVEGMAYDAYKVDFGLIPYRLKDPNQVDKYDEEGKGIASKVFHDYGIIPDIIECANSIFMQALLRTILQRSFQYLQAGILMVRNCLRLEKEVTTSRECLMFAKA
ncbi:MAG: hypothetical protein GPW19_00415 [Euryarchaeota archaeon]|nr:hypothetical protein [Euryarchaeota archaeon]